MGSKEAEVEAFKALIREQIHEELQKKLPEIVQAVLTELGNRLSDSLPPDQTDTAK